MVQGTGSEAVLGALTAHGVEDETRAGPLTRRPAGRTGGVACADRRPDDRQGRQQAGEGPIGGVTAARPGESKTDRWSLASSLIQAANEDCKQTSTESGPPGLLWCRWPNHLAPTAAGAAAVKFNKAICWPAWGDNRRCRAGAICSHVSDEGRRGWLVAARPAQNSTSPLDSQQ
jgi:hypothetical protein